MHNFNQNNLQPISNTLIGDPRLVRTPAEIMAWLAETLDAHAASTSSKRAIELLSGEID